MEQRFCRRSRFSLHDQVDHNDGRFLANGCDVEVDHRRVQVRMSQVLLNESQIDSSFEQVGGVAVTQRMCRDATVFPTQLTE